MHHLGEEQSRHIEAHSDWSQKNRQVVRSLLIQRENMRSSTEGDEISTTEPTVCMREYNGTLQYTVSLLLPSGISSI